MSLRIIFGVIVFGFVILVLTGLGILTSAIFGISEDKTYSTIAGAQNPQIVEFINSKQTNPTGYTDAMKTADLASIPTGAASQVAANSGKYIINLSGSNLTVAKISLIIFWILIIISIIGIKFI